LSRKPFGLRREEVLALTREYVFAVYFVEMDAKRNEIKREFEYEEELM